MERASHSTTRFLLNELWILHANLEGVLTVLILRLAASLERDENIRKMVHIRSIQHANFHLIHGQRDF